jgi:hypothetical protein
MYSLFSSLIVVSLLFLAKYFFGIFFYLQIIDYFRLRIDDLRNAFDCKIISSERRSEATSTNRQLSIFDLQFFFFGSGLSGLGSGINDHPVLRTGRIEFLRPSGEKQKHFSASNAARTTGCNASGLFGKQ